jgi:hypothetical protein
MTATVVSVVIPSRHFWRSRDLGEPRDLSRSLRLNNARLARFLTQRRKGS